MNQQPQQEQPSSITTSHSCSSLTEELLASPVSPTGPHTEADAQRGMSCVDSWKPQFNRRQSWSKEEHKHALQMSRVGNVKTGPGFSERP